MRRAHHVALDADGEAVGLLLLREVRGGVALDTVGVVPRVRRRGVSAALLAAALAALPEVEVRSSWLIANRESAAWHARCGFETVPTSVSQRSRLAAEWWRDRATLGERMAAEDDLREREAAEREGRAPDPFSFARPIHRPPSGVR